MQQILGILLIGGAVVFTSIVSENNRIESQKGQHNFQNSRAVLGAVDDRGDKELFKTEVFFGSGQQASLERLIKEQGLEVFPEDRLKTFPSPELKIGFVLQLTRALPVKVVDGKKERLFRTFQTKVKGLLDEKGVELGERDIVKPGFEAELARGTTIVIVRVEETEVKVRRKVDFTTQFQNDPNLDKGLTRLIQAGRPGKKELVYRVRRENGEEVGRDLINTEILDQPVAKIVARGTKEVIYGTGVATWFKAPKMTAAHNSLPRGAKVEVTNLSNGKSVVVEVIGGGIRGRAIIDLSPDAFTQLASLNTGVIKVKLTKP